MLNTNQIVGLQQQRSCFHIFSHSICLFIFIFKKYALRYELAISSQTCAGNSATLQISLETIYPRMTCGTVLWQIVRTEARHSWVEFDGIWVWYGLVRSKMESSWDLHIKMCYPKFKPFQTQTWQRSKAPRSAAVYLHSRSGDWCAALHSHESWTGQVPKGTWTGQRLLKVIQGLTDSNSLTSKLKLAGWNGEGYEQESKEQNRLFSSVHVAASCSHLPLQMELAYS